MLFFISVFGFSQNLVINPSFEAFHKCPPGIGFFDRSINDWTIPNNGTTDYFNLCNDRLGIENYNGSQKPKSGNAYAGVYLFSSYSNYREYVQGELTEQLRKGEEYNVTFYISLAEHSTHAVKDIQMLFSEEKIKKCFSKKLVRKVIKPKKATKKKFRIHNNEAVTHFNRRDQWIEVSFTFVAEGFEQFFSIGNFYNDSKTDLSEILKVNRKEHKFSYYYIDDVSVTSTTPAFTEAQEIITPKVEEEVFETNTTYEFSNVLFEFDKAELKRETIEELDVLLAHLIAKPELNIEIYGHTDYVGTIKRNKELSMQRAKAVAEYLILHGLEPRRVQWFGFGSAKPITTNETEAGRRKNRRVEFKLLE